MNDENYYCKRCKEPFSHLKSQANAFEDQFEENGRAMSQHDRAADGAIVQLECNPAHVFHAECIESFVFCPECFVPINNPVANSQMDERSVGPPRSDCDSQEEDLLDINQNSDHEDNGVYAAQNSRHPRRIPSTTANVASV